MEVKTESVCYEEEVIIEDCELNIKIKDPLNIDIPLLTCDTCDFMTTSSVDLEGHKQTHRGCYLMCTKCDFVTSSVLLLNEHLQSHTYVEKCEKCEFSCELDDDMKLHVEVHHHTPWMVSIEEKESEISEESSLCNQQNHSDNSRNPEQSHLQSRDSNIENSPTKNQSKEEFLTSKKRKVKIEFISPENTPKRKRAKSSKFPKIKLVKKELVSPKVGQRRGKQAKTGVSPGTSHKQKSVEARSDPRPLWTPDAVPSTSWAPDAVPSTSWAPDAVPSTSWAPDAVPSTSWAPDAVPTTSRSPALPASPSPPDSPAFPPSPALYMKCSTTSRVASSSHQSVRLSEEDVCLALENLGSEADDDDDDDEDDDVDFVQNLNISRRYVSELYNDDHDDQLPPVVIDHVETATTTAPDTVGPQDFYDFQWRAFTEPPISPELRRESFSSHKGPTAPNPDPYKNFVSIWDREIMENIAAETNAYAQEVAASMADHGTLAPKSRICFWRDVTVNELYILFAIFIAMGAVIKGKIADYWNTANNIFLTPGFREQMSLRRFEMLCACLHFNSNSNMPTNLDAGQAKLYKLQPILNHLNSKFQAMYDLSQNIALDESLLKWPGWWSINQHIPNKAARMGIKSYELCESQTGYLWRFEIHSVKVPIPPSTDPMCSAIPATVLRLLQGIENKGHTLWMDNFYNSPALARKLKSLGTDCVGTLRTNKQFVPPAIKNLTKESMRPGQISSVTSGDVDLTVWRDRNRVATISTYHGNGAFEVSGERKPILLLDYNIMMGGVDKKDHMISSYPMERNRSKIWYKKLFRRLLNVSVLNCYIISKQSGCSLNHRNFRYKLVDDILINHSTNPRPIRVPPTPTTTTHGISLNPLRGCGKGRLRRRCTVCHKQTIYHCPPCNKAMCAIECYGTVH